MYSGPVKRILLSPINGRVGDHYNGFGSCEKSISCKTNPDRISRNRVHFKVCIENGYLIDLRWDIFGDPVAIATASWCVWKAKGKTVADLVNIVTPEVAALELHITDELDIRSGCCTAIEALAAAIDDYNDNY